MRLFFLLLMMLSGSGLTGQNTSFWSDIDLKILRFSGDVPHFSLGRMKTTEALKEDEINGHYRIAYSVDEELDILRRSKKYFHLNGKVSLAIGLVGQSDLGTALFFDNINLPLGAKIALIDKKTGSLIQAFEEGDWMRKNRFITDLFRGNEMILLVHLDAPLEEKSKLILSKSYTLFRTIDSFGKRTPESGFGASLPCQVNAICPDAQEYAEQKKSVVRILMVFDEGLGLCSGNLINNTSLDRTPYILSAYHCQYELTPMYDLWRFDFEYQSQTCSNLQNEPSFTDFTGCSMVSGRLESDFLLLRLNKDLPSDMDVHFSGWDRRDLYLPDRTFMFHHPKGDVKKFSLDNDLAELHSSTISWSSGISTPPDHHFRTYLDLGTQEPGSSGAGLYDGKMRLVGQLHGGFTDDQCQQTLAYFGRLQKSWDEGLMDSEKLKPWLDPLDLGLEQLDGIANGITSRAITVSVVTPLEVPLPNVDFEIVQGEITQQVMSDETGNISFQIEDSGTEVRIRPSKNTNVINGITTIDLLAIQKHVLGISPFDDPIKLLAADINGSEHLSSTDVGNLRKVILDIWDQFPNDTPSWHFLPEEIQFDPSQMSNAHFDFVGFKMGDVNYSADPGN